jgi:predicted DNA-binding protein
MPAKSPRINVVLEKSLYRHIQQLAKNEGVSLSLKVRDLIREALEAHEDMALAKFAEERERTFDTTKALAHKEVW